MRPHPLDTSLARPLCHNGRYSLSADWFGRSTNDAIISYYRTDTYHRSEEDNRDCLHPSSLPARTGSAKASRARYADSPHSCPYRAPARPVKATTKMTTRAATIPSTGFSTAAVENLAGEAEEVEVVATAPGPSEHKVQTGVNLRVVLPSPLPPPPRQEGHGVAAATPIYRWRGARNVPRHHPQQAAVLVLMISTRWM